MNGLATINHVGIPTRILDHSLPTSGIGAKGCLETLIRFALIFTKNVLSLFDLPLFCHCAWSMNYPYPSPLSSIIVR